MDFLDAFRPEKASKYIGENNLDVTNTEITIEQNVFGGCPLKTVEVNKNIVWNSYYAKSCFAGVTTVSDVRFGSAVSKISNELFAGCINIEHIEVDESNPHFSSAADVLFNKEKNILLWVPTAKNVGNYSIPDGVETINQYAFKDCPRLSKICIESTSSIQNNTINIHNDSFAGCGNLSTLFFDRNIFVIRFLNSPFRNIRSVVIGNSVSVLGISIFANCENLNSIVIPNSVDTIKSYAFYDCKNLESITFGNEVTKIGEGTFSYCESLQEIKLPLTLKSIAYGAFSNCKGLSSIDLSNNSSLTSIGTAAFANCTGLTSIKFNNNLKTIGEETFKNCTGLSSIKIPNTITYVGMKAFENCTGLKELVIGDEEKSPGEIRFESDVFNGCNNISSIVWNRNLYNNLYSAPFIGFKKLTSVTISENVTELPYFAFYGCSALETLIIPESVTSIDILSYTFLGSDNIKELIVYNPEAVSKVI